MRIYKNIDIRLQHKCPHCHTLGRPLKRIWGFPGPGPIGDALRKSDEQGRITLMGCTMQVCPVDYECRHCGEDWKLKQAE